MSRWKPNDLHQAPRLSTEMLTMSISAAAFATRIWRLTLSTFSLPPANTRGYCALLNVRPSITNDCEDLNEEDIVSVVEYSHSCGILFYLSWTENRQDSEEVEGATRFQARPAGRT
ncbi:hypothetical protein M409DRAFT_19306 [Zasmidium cellare ATCC 36951]|uniref:Uncharacterized protein n=1 Tax=Zasmidium cellare ATCC 36951 TaxID=1080233 RepID=A0A6A6CTV9_ZASCE|nr:uncharacterized protein M409DRAFT_19306 [Zasmidium cellare ATCC 36951]KAF2170485.1 hypothetical protein M409DRAFT_19306 [Zasmidium cellare ATCC 36951]